jgi:hypothetical protein
LIALFISCFDISTPLIFVLFSLVFIYLLGAPKTPNQPHLISNRASHVLIHCSFSLFNHEDDDYTVTTTTRRREQKEREI